MMKLDYAGGQVLVSDQLCHVLLTYSADVARAGGSETLQIPVVTIDGIRGIAEVVVGPASQLLATPTDMPDVDLDDTHAIEEIVARTAATKPPKALPVSASDLTADLDSDL